MHNPATGMIAVGMIATAVADNSGRTLINKVKSAAERLSVKLDGFPLRRTGRSFLRAPYPPTV